MEARVSASSACAASTDQIAEVDDQDWDQPRWLRILERMEHRQAGVGLRFWGPPLWLEVTMVGPDSDAWSTAAALDLPDQPWNWESTAPCAEAMGLAAAGADDERLLSAASRYTFENLVLNATHEIGEWLRFDAQRIFSAHGERGPLANPSGQGPGDGLQGNGRVDVYVDFEGGQAKGVAPADISGGQSETASERMTTRLAAVAAAWRFSYLPGKSISYGPQGPLVTDTVSGQAGQPIVWGSSWSAATWGLTAGPAADFVAAVQRDVHRLLVLYETHLICEAFRVDGQRTWRLEPPGAPVGDPLPASNPPDRSAPDRPGLAPIALSITYDG